MTNRQAQTQSDTLSKTLPASTLTERCDVLIIGAGLAGITTALSLPRHLSVVVLAKQDLTACSSHYAQGGIAAVIDEEDSVIEHVSDTLIAGDGLCDVDATTQILSQGASAIEWLLEHNVPFTPKKDSMVSTTTDISRENNLSPNTLNLMELHLTQEGGHSRRRVAHADDATGRHIMTALLQDVTNAPNIEIRPYHEALSLKTEHNQCTGALVIDTQSHSIIEFQSQAVVLASGGLGQLFSRATAPNVCVGDGIMMAWEAGARLANLEFIQFHPTGLVVNDEQGDRNFLISEAVRGEGGYLLNPITGKRFMPEYDERAELAPRDIVARAIANEINQQDLGYVHLDISHQPAEFIQEHFPDIYAHCLSLGIDITTDPIPVAPTAHYTCGGVLATATGLTDVKGLYAAGEVANTGLHGANRLASNSLLECVVVGREIATHLPLFINNSASWQGPVYKETKKKLNSNHLEFSVATDDLLLSTSQSLILSKEATFTNLNLEDLTRNIDPLKSLMTQKMGIRRQALDLKAGLKQVLYWKQQLQDHCKLNIDNARFNKERLDNEPFENEPFNKDQFRLNRLLTLASMLFKSALVRMESRGGHFRDDYPTLALNPAISVIYPIVENSKSVVTSEKNKGNNKKTFLNSLDVKPFAFNEVNRMDQEVDEKINEEVN